MDVAHRNMISEVTKFPGLEGPPTIRESIESILRRTPGSFMSHHDRWGADSQIDKGARSIHEHKVLCLASQFGIDVDGLNVKNLVSFQYVNRRRLLLEEAHKDDPAYPVFEGASHYMGDEVSGCGVAIAPTLRAHVAVEMGKDAAIAKERRKVQDTRAALASSRAGAKALAP